MKHFILFILSVALVDTTNAQDLFRSACQGNLVRVDSLLGQSSIDTIDARGRTLLHWALACDEPELFNAFLRRDIRINVEDNQGMTPMHMAVRFDRPAYFDTLVSRQIADSWQVEYGGSLLEIAVLKKRSSFLEKLTFAGIDINSLNDRGSTALEIATRTGSDEIKAQLLTLGANPSLIRSIKAYGAYMGQPAPGVESKVFAPNFISTEEYEFGSIFNAAGTEFYFGVDVGSRSEIRSTRLVDGKWSNPEVLLSHPDYGYNDPFLSPDEQRLYFISQRPLDGTSAPKEDHDIWYVQRSAEGWSEPINAGKEINTDKDEYYISFTSNGAMYFSSNGHGEIDESSNWDIYASHYVNGAFTQPLDVGAAINTEAYEADVFVDPNEAYLIFCSTREGSLGRGDLFISFKRSDGTWTQAINMGEQVNTREHELCPFVSADQKYLFYTSNEDIRWISTEILKSLRKQVR